MISGNNARDLRRLEGRLYGPDLGRSHARIQGGLWVPNSNSLSNGGRDLPDNVVDFNAYRLGREIKRLGQMPGPEDDSGLLGGSYDRLKKYYEETFWGSYGPLKDPGKNIKNWVGNGISHYVWKQVADHFKDSKSFWGKNIETVSSGLSVNYKNQSLTAAQDLSPLLRTIVSAYGSGKTNVHSMWVYAKDGKEFPVFLNTFQDLERDNSGYPNKDQLVEAIQFVDRESKSPFNDMEKDVSSKILNQDFIRYAADTYTGGCYKLHFEDEPTKVHRWFFREDTKGKWERDLAAETALPTDLPPEYSGRIRVYKKSGKKDGFLYHVGKNIFQDDRPKSWSLVTDNLIGDFTQDIAFWLMGGFVFAETLKKLGVENPGIREAMYMYYKIGSNMQESLGVRRNFAYEF